jgi:hypothetical protein
MFSILSLLQINNDITQFLTPHENYSFKDGTFIVLNVWLFSKKHFIIKNDLCCMRNMAQIILFESEEIAERIATYLPQVEVQSNCLTFTSFFDENALKLALGLEKLDRQDYCYAYQYCFLPNCCDVTRDYGEGRQSFLIKAKEVAISLEKFQLAIAAFSNTLAQSAFVKIDNSSSEPHQE